MGQIQLTTSLILIGLFTVAIIGFTVNFALDNNSPVDISNDPELSSLNSQTKGNLSQFGSGAESSYKSIIETTIEPGGQSFQSSGPFSITPINALGVVKNIMKTGYMKIFGGGKGFGLFLTALISILIFMLGLYVYKTLRGFPD